MAQFNIFRVCTLAITTNKHGDFNTHNIITVDDEGKKEEVTIYTNTGKELIRSVNGKRIIDEVA